ncbi:hypothetical protein COP2_013346 [Malus domestica]|uniref:Uncharacterized protein n=1 Tax=Malus domestica TaxID=3750 RepID=A0A498I8T3_MALDO|nr:hypothetical protein DVH24_002112 [Malus domestica]
MIKLNMGSGIGLLSNMLRACLLHIVKGSKLAATIIPHLAFKPKRKSDVGFISVFYKSIDARPSPFRTVAQTRALESSLQSLKRKSMESITTPANGVAGLKVKSALPFFALDSLSRSTVPLVFLLPLSSLSTVSWNQPFFKEDFDEHHSV